MIITQTPFRMSFFGGGTDVASFFKCNGGTVLSTTFDKYCYVTVRHLPPFFDYKTHLTYSDTEYINNNDEIRHPAIRNTMEYVGIKDIRLTYDADLPARSGLGTSSSFVVGMLNAFYALQGKYASAKRLADEAIYIERELCGEAGGWQDQIAAAFGGFNRIYFRDDSYEVKPVIISTERKRELNESLLMFFTGFTRISSDIMKERDNLDDDKEEKLKRMCELTDEAEKVLVDSNSNLDEFGVLLNEEWMLKKGSGKNISTEYVDRYYKIGIRAGALGGKLLGAGGGGFLLFYVPENKREAVREAMKDLLFIPFNFEDNGTRIVHYSPEDQ